MNKERLQSIYNALNSDESFMALFSDSDLSQSMHALAENKDEHLYKLLIERFVSLNGSVKEEVLNLVGFHYNLSDNSNLLEKIFSIIVDNTISENDEGLRETAAIVYGLQIKQIDHRMIISLDKIDSYYVRLALLKSLLRSSGISPAKVDKMTEIIEIGHGNIDSKTFYSLSGQNPSEFSE